MTVKLKFRLRPFLGRKIIVIGAGMSGMSCAEHLQSLGFTNVTILEASDRLGGRLCTETSEEGTDEREWSYFEMGSQRVHLGTSVSKIAEESHQIDETAPDYAEALKQFCPTYGRTAISAIQSMRWWFLQRTLLPKNFDDLNILKDEQFIKMFEDCEDNTFNVAKSHMKGAFAWWYGLAYEYTFEKKQKELICGFVGILRLILEKLSPNTVFFNKEVTAVDWLEFTKNESGDVCCNSPKVKIKCRDESTYEADHVIFAIPLGYLKENYETLFIPSLPDVKIQAIEDLTFVTVNKIFLKFEDRFWEPSDVYHVIWNDKMENLFTDIFHEDGMSALKWIRDINRFEYVHTNKKLLCAWIWGEGAIIMESLKKEEIAKCCMVLLEYLTGKSLLPKPKDITVSTWHSNPLFRGSVIYDPSKPIYDLIKRAAGTVVAVEVSDGTRTIRPVLQFTCDVGDMDIVSSVEGARSSGIKTAEELYLYYRYKSCIDTTSLIQQCT